MQAYDRVSIARAKGRPTALKFIGAIFEDFFELHGDRLFGDDGAIVGGVALLGGKPVTVIGIEKGDDTLDKVARNFGCAHPEGYRKALRHLQLAEKFGRPVITLVDTSGAYCGIGAEERGEGHAIAQCITAMMGLKVPEISLIIGEGGSGGALALAAANEVWMLENAVYSVLSPEGAASIIWKDASRTREAAQSLKLTAGDLLELGVIERVFPESDGFDALYPRIQGELIETLDRYAAMDTAALLKQRYQKFRCIGGQL